MSIPSVRLKPERERAVLAGHPWIFSGAIEDATPEVVPGAIVRLERWDGEFIGYGYANPKTTIAVRLLTRVDEAIDAPFVRQRIVQALAWRDRVVRPETNAFRLLNGEADMLPGVVVDVYAGHVVLQCLTAGADLLKPLIVESLVELLHPACILERSSGAVRRQEGLADVAAVLHGIVPDEPITIEEHGLRFQVDLLGGQKTGFFCDQRDNRALVRSLARGRRVLNAFAFTDAFGVHAAAGGARQVVSVESSAKLRPMAAANWKANSVPLISQFRVGDVSEYLRETEHQFDMLIIDPPALVRRRQEVERGARAYKDLNLWAFKRARVDALMLTFSCSQHVSHDLFWKIVAGAAADAGRSVQVLRRLGPGADHPVLLAHPEGEYLTGLLVKIST